MRESRTRLVILHLAPIFFAGVLVAVDAGPLTVLDIVHPKGILHVIVSLILVLAQTLEKYFTLVHGIIKCALNDRTIQTDRT